MGLILRPEADLFWQWEFWLALLLCRGAEVSGGALSDTRFVEVSVDRGARNLEQVGDALDGVFSCVVELLGVVGLIGGKFRASSSSSSSGAGCREAIAGVSDDEFSLEFGKDREHTEYRPSFRRGGIDALLEDAQSNTTISEGCTEGHEVEYRAAESVQAGDDELVAGPVGQGESFLQLGSAGFGADGVVEVYVGRVNAGTGERVCLVVWILVSGGNARISD